MRDYNEFLRALRGESGRAVLFEPFPGRKIVTQLIWRGGGHLWDTAEHYVSTLAEFYAYIKSDVVIADARCWDIGELLSCRGLLPEGMRFVIIADDADSLAVADADTSVCALATASEATGSYSKPLIYLCRGGDIGAEIDRAIGRGCAGIYLPDKIEEHSDARGKIALLGGLGLERISSDEPMDIYRRVERLYREGGWIIGSGRIDDAAENINYLGFISMLGIYNKLI